MTGHRARLAEAGAAFAAVVGDRWAGPTGAAELWREFSAAVAVAEASARAIDPGHEATARFADLADLCDEVAAAIDYADEVKARGAGKGRV